MVLIVPAVGSADIGASVAESAFGGMEDDAIDESAADE